MIEKLKKLLLKDEATVEKLKELEIRKKKMKPKLLEAEDGGSDPKLRQAWEKIKNQIETAGLRRTKLGDDIREECGNLIDYQIKQVPREQEKLAAQRNEILQAAGEMLGKASLVFKGLGSDAVGIAPEIFSILQSHQNLTLPMIEGWAKAENSGGPRDEFMAKRVLHDRLRNIDPQRRTLLITKYAGAVRRADFEYLEGR